MNILLVEDDQKAARLLARGLAEEGFALAVAQSAEQATALLDVRTRLVILDWMLPGQSGAELCGAWRANGVRLPILMLTARDAVADRITGLNVGADDYLTKPFAFEELLARVRALLRRTEPLPPPAPTLVLQVADLEINMQTHAVTRGSRAIILTPKEYAILLLLAQHTGQVVSRLQLAEQVWAADLIAIDNLIDVHMKNMRRKVDALGHVALIETVRGQGFRLNRGMTIDTNAGGHA